MCGEERGGQRTASPVLVLSPLTAHLEPPVTGSVSQFTTRALPAPPLTDNIGQQMSWQQ